MTALVNLCRAHPRATSYMTVRQAALLDLAVTHPGRSCLFYAVELGVQRPIITRACVQLAALGLLQTRRAAGDRRQNVIEATEAGIAFVAAGRDEPDRFGLLDAAQRALQALEGIDKMIHGHGLMQGVECPAIPFLRAAIAKARGQS
jgi:DNA-binding MarR family transcriptional regulator